MLRCANFGRKRGKRAFAAPRVKAFFAVGSYPSQYFSSTEF
jgi:hypothetical protein